MGFKGLICMFFFMVYTVVNGDHLSSQNGDLKGTGCVCEGYSCGCCVYIDAPEIGLNDSACVNVTYLPKEYGIHFTMNVDRFFIYNETISVRNPPPLCSGAPILEDFAELCIHFYDLDATTTKLHGCVDIEGRLKHIVVAKYSLGCFNLGGLKRQNSRLTKYHADLIQKIQARNKLSVNNI